MPEDPGFSPPFPEPAPTEAKVKYRIVTGKIGGPSMEPESLERNVQKYLNAGWELYGGPSPINTVTGMQAVIKFEEER